MMDMNALLKRLASRKLGVTALCLIGVHMGCNEALTSGVAADAVLQMRVFGYSAIGSFYALGQGVADRGAA